MRIIGGKHRGRTLKEFPGNAIRPTSDRARESLFNILQNKVPGCVFLDLFCGTGGVGIEALSRGAEEVWFSDAAKESVALTKSNLALVKESAEVFLGDALQILQKAATHGKKFDVIFLDPPYASDVGEKALSEIRRLGLLTDGGVAVYEHGGREPVSALCHYDRRKYGVAVFDFYRRPKEDDL